MKLFNFHRDRISKMSLRECKEVSDSDSAAYGFVCALTRNAKLLSAHAHSQQNQQPVDIWQSALHCANEGYSETEQERTRMWWARIDTKVDAKSGDIRVWGTREGRGHFEAISGNGCITGTGDIIESDTVACIYKVSSVSYIGSHNVCVYIVCMETSFQKKIKEGRQVFAST